MNQARYTELMDNQDSKLTQEEIDLGWHFCNEFDGLLVGPEMGELEVCKCLPEDHAAYKTYPARIGRDWLKDSSLEKWFPITAEELSTLRTQLKSVEAERDEANAGAAVMREALEGMYHSDTVQTISESLAAMVKAREALSTNAGKSYQARMEEAVRLLCESADEHRHRVTPEWLKRRDAFLNPKP